MRILSILLLALITVSSNAHSVNKKKVDCKDIDIKCASTVTATFDENSTLWLLWSQNQSLVLQTSTDYGKSYSKPKVIEKINEPISSRGENRPKIIVDKDNIYLSWARPGKKRFTGDVRFSASYDKGKTFIDPITVNNDQLEIGHSFNEMQLQNNHVSLIWLDKREAFWAKKKNQPYLGSALYKGQWKPEGKQFSNQKLADNTCVCCRIALTTDSDENLVVMWRHIFGDNIRDHALLSEVDNKLQRVSDDNWKINGCPHQGPGLSIDNDGKRHMVWYTQGNNRKGVFYRSQSAENFKSSDIFDFSISDKQNHHPHVLASNNRVDIVWLTFNGEYWDLMRRASVDSGKSFKSPEILDSSSDEADRPFLISDNKRTFVSWHKKGAGYRLIAL
ncbi:sialidase family protein [Pleionea sp. CnH1-48]|uniref:sialidase family protein n=1 Tax=Pleionea sp. CnH1-48 TaxID=2954494 RepID=UPI002096A5AA|nr:sialidase family protein [Pleionea sp. CnH1-48]MCO7225148.1 glycoside hydrolase [Pleionea sp. CnH1-48]